MNKPNRTSVIVTAITAAAAIATALNLPDFQGDAMVRFAISANFLMATVLAFSVTQNAQHTTIPALAYLTTASAAAWAMCCAIGPPNQAPQGIGVLFVCVGQLLFLSATGRAIKDSVRCREALKNWGTETGVVIIGTAIEPIKAGSAVALRVVDGSNFVYPANLVGSENQIG
jgi:hypothetical protein